MSYVNFFVLKLTSTTVLKLCEQAKSSDERRLVSKICPKPPTKVKKTQIRAIILSSCNLLVLASSTVNDPRGKNQESNNASLELSVRSRYTFFMQVEEKVMVTLKIK